MPDTPSLTLIKQFDYRGLPEEWSNTYHFKGVATPSTDAGWREVMLNFWFLEREVIQPSSKLVRGYGYTAGNEHSVAQLNFEDVDNSDKLGNNTDAGVNMAGDQAVWIRAKIGTSSSGKKVYIRKYYHDVPLGATGGDNIYPTTVPKLQQLAETLTDGNMQGGAVWCGPQAEDPSLPFAPNFPTTRTLKRRGKRPTGP
jgi:hypothetical protein